MAHVRHFRTLSLHAGRLITAHSIDLLISQHHVDLSRSLHLWADFQSNSVLSHGSTIHYTRQWFALFPPPGPACCCNNLFCGIVWWLIWQIELFPSSLPSYRASSWPIRDLCDVQLSLIDAPADLNCARLSIAKMLWTGSDERRRRRSGRRQFTRIPAESGQRVRNAIIKINFINFFSLDWSARRGYGADMLKLKRSKPVITH